MYVVYMCWQCWEKHAPGCLQTAQLCPSILHEQSQDMGRDRVSPWAQPLVIKQCLQSEHAA